jgi:hypothetical protein
MGIQSLGINEGDQYIYNIESMDSWLYEMRFGKVPFGDDHDQMKVEINTITETSEYWDLELFFWEPGKNFDSYGAAYTNNYKIYKRALNKKGGTDWFIPNSNVDLYNSRADNAPGCCNLNTGSSIDSWWDEGRQEFITEYRYELRWEKVEIWFRYNGSGILKEMTVRDKSFGDIYQLRLEEDYCWNCDDDYEQPLIKIPGYDLLITISILFAIISIIVIKIKKSIRK